MSEQPCPHLYRHLIQADIQRHPHWGEVAVRGASAEKLRRQQPVAFWVVCWACGEELPPVGEDGRESGIIEE